jgi:hypothetical protein
LDGSCVATCSEGASIIAGDDLNCQECFEGCKTCLGLGYNQCINCIGKNNHFY